MGKNHSAGLNNNPFMSKKKKKPTAEEVGVQRCCPVRSGSTTSPLHSLSFMEQGHPSLPGLHVSNPSGVPLLLPSCSGAAFQHGFAFAVERAGSFPDLAEGWCMHPEHSAATQPQETSLGWYSSQRGVFPVLQV